MVGSARRPHSVSIRIIDPSTPASRRRRNCVRISAWSRVSTITSHCPASGAVRAASRRLSAPCRRLLFPCPGTGPDSRAGVRTASQLDRARAFRFGDHLSGRLQLAPRSSSHRPCIPASQGDVKATEPSSSRHPTGTGPVHRNRARVSRKTVPDRPLTWSDRQGTESGAGCRALSTGRGQGVVGGEEKSSVASGGGPCGQRRPGVCGPGRSGTPGGVLRCEAGEVAEEGAACGAVDVRNRVSLPVGRGPVRARGRGNQQQRRGRPAAHRCPPSSCGKRG